MNVQSRFKLPQNSSSLHQRRKSSISVRPKPSSSSDCLFCTRKLKESYYPKMIVKALFTKFASSQNYYYTRDINDILANNRTRAVILHKDLSAFLEEDEEYLKRYYQIHENSFKMKLLVEYYKFHRDIPRLYMQPTSDVMNRYHDKRRRIEYVKIKKMLKEQEKQENGSIVSDTNIQETGNSNADSDKKLEPRLKIPIGNVLEGIDLEKEDPAKSNPTEQLAKMLNNNKCEVSNSYSLLDLNRKLLDITEQKSELFLPEDKATRFHDLSNFLSYMKTKLPKKQQKMKPMEELSEIERETTDSGFCVINFPAKPIFKPEPAKKPQNNNKGNPPIKEIFAGVKKLDLSKLPKPEESGNSKHDDTRPLSSNRKQQNQPPSARVNPVMPFPNKTHREEVRTQRLGPGIASGLYKINSERVVYERKTKNFVEIANEAANKIINKSQNILKKDPHIISQKAIPTNQIVPPTNHLTNLNTGPTKGNHTRVNSLYCTTNTKSQTKVTPKDNTASPSLKNPVSYNNFFQTRGNMKKDSAEENYNFSKNGSLNKSGKKISHKYTKSDPNLLFPKMMQGLTLNHFNNSNHNGIINGGNQPLFSIKENIESKRKVEHSKKLSANNKNEDSQKKTTVSTSALKTNPQFYTINQNNVLNIYFGDAKGTNIKIKPKTKNIFFGNNNLNKPKT